MCLWCRRWSRSPPAADTDGELGVKGVLAKIAKAISYLVLTAWALVLFVPMVWMVLSAFTPQSELQTAVPMRRTFQSFQLRMLWDWGEAASWARSYFTTENFHSPGTDRGLFDITAMPRREFLNAPVHGWAVRAWLRILGKEPPTDTSPVLGGRLILWFENTLFVALVVTVLSVLLNAMAGYAFAKFEFWGHRWLFWLILATIMIPGQVTLIPLFLLFTRGLQWYDSFWPVILPQVAAPVGIFLMRQYIQSLPSQLEDAARIDGCTEIGIFARVILPLSKPILAVWAIFTFIGAWKAFLWPLVITDDQNRFMLEVGLKTLQFTAGPRNVGVVMSAAVLASIPMVLIFFAFQRYLTKGLTIGAVKG
ncbi:MAG: carbohydrate ABC transporter permease [Candidatus Sumerlaea chitinivorans]|uniref:N-Acetyl-D-glucosamine ABC transport system, permease protein 2 n=1 Tax=Sumerlaea chitinivorans TaxID=2250252 RepID=A0A2Z4Y7C1_SUMC1|nr:N-Acetyl-D-glucosamine ABC transport system, permease protein 2 [Candidatus Sumerlaea chitinivorans]MCX7964030.1 carbohydrate ABC transporter permease [Candidatus Sumerlaea chitinivorans]